MFNTHEHILHLYECIDELRDEIHLIRMRQNMNSINSIPSWYNPDVLNDSFSSSETPRVNTTSTGLNWSVELENNRRELNDSYLNLPNRRPSSTRSGASGARTNRNSRTTNVSGSSTSTSASTNASANASANRVNRGDRLNRSIISNGLTPPSNPTVTAAAATPNSIEFTFYEPRISSVRERLDTLLNSLRRDYNLPPIGSTRETRNRTTIGAGAASGAASGTSDNNLNTILDSSLGVGLGLGPDSNLGDDNERRLTLSEINTGCETKIHTGEDETCSICREVINETSIVREIKNCRHKFHQLCLDTWLENRRTCPICRGEVCLSADTAIRRAAEARAATSNTEDSVVNDLD